MQCATAKMGHRLCVTGLRHSRRRVSSATAALCGVDFERYPLNDLAGAAMQSVLAKARSDLAATGCASFPGFLSPDATAAAAVQASRAAPSAFVTDDWHNAYQLPGQDPELPPNHVRNLLMRTRVASTAWDELQPEDELRRLYEYDGLPCGAKHSE